MTEEPQADPRHRSAIEAFESSNAVVELLARHRIVVAPHVAARLGLGLAGDADSIIEVAAQLRASQRLGLATLPDPLPVVPAVDAAFGASGALLAPWERQALVVASVCADDRIDVLLAATGCTMADFVESGVSRHLLLVAGHFAFADPRMRVWVHARATLSDRTAAHAALAEAYAAADVDDQSIWHRSLATLEGSSDLVEPLLGIARRADAAGEAEWAHTVAREAASHAGGEQAVLARCIAGRAALHGGFVEDAERWFGEVLRHGDERSRAAVLGEYVIAVTMLSGDVPDRELDERLERAAHGEVAAEVCGPGLARAVIVAAGLLAERGAMQRAAHRLEQARTLFDGAGLPRDEWRIAHAWCSLFAGADLGPAWPDAPDSDATTTRAEPTSFEGFRAITQALERGLAGDPEGAAGRLGIRRDLLGEAIDPRVSGVERSPLMRAERAVAIALLELWAGEVQRAANGLRQAASDLPIALAFGGLGAALARRLEIISTGSIGPWARALEAVLPQPVLGVRREDLVDRAVAAHLQGRRAEAETLVALADERARSGFGCGLHLPGLDAAAEEVVGLEAVGAADPGAETLGCEPPGAAPCSGRRTPDARLASELRHRVRSIDRLGFEADYAVIAERARAIVSPYERARTELMLARVCAAFGAIDRASRHLLTAEHLFGDCGAVGWLRAVAAERRTQAAASLAAPGATASPTAGVPSPQTSVSTVVVGHPPSVDAIMVASGDAVPDSEGTAPWDLAECRGVWARLLTERELEVAMLVVEGISNRDAAARLFVSVRTVEVHVGRVFSKLDVHSRVELAVLAHRMRGRMSGSYT